MKKSKITTRVLAKLPPGISVIDIPLADVDPKDLRGYPTTDGSPMEVVRDATGRIVIAPVFLKEIKHD